MCYKFCDVVIEKNYFWPPSHVYWSNIYIVCWTPVTSKYSFFQKCSETMATYIKKAARKFREIPKRQLVKKTWSYLLVGSISNGIIRASKANHFTIHREIKSISKTMNLHHKNRMPKAGGCADRLSGGGCRQPTWNSYFVAWWFTLGGRVGTSAIS